ncbi:MAG: MBL fold metallo-hydrolase [Myxococcales bacterium]|nr:MBL fold metallo-hydrolase [Myxococcales bacterium]
MALIGELGVVLAGDGEPALMLIVAEREISVWVCSSDGTFTQVSRPGWCLSVPSYVDNDLAAVRAAPNGGGAATVVLYRGDEIDILGRQGEWTQVGLGVGRSGWVRRLKVRSTGLLELAFIDVGQGDACLITTPERRKVLIDGGENQLAARYLARRFGGGTVVFDAIVVTHGDADHFSGLSRLVEAANEPRPEKRIRIETDRVFHNGLVKRPASILSSSAWGHR